MSGHPVLNMCIPVLLNSWESKLKKALLLLFNVSIIEKFIKNGLQANGPS